MTIPKTGNDAFILGNIDAVGYYRVAYDKTMWNAIVAKMTSAEYTVSFLTNLFKKYFAKQIGIEKRFALFVKMLKKLCNYKYHQQR